MSFVCESLYASEKTARPSGSLAGEATVNAQGEIPEGVLIDRTMRGDLEAYNQIVERHQANVLLHCSGLLRDSALAEDITQETFVKAWRGLSKFRGDSMRSWLMRIATNGCLDVLRQRSRRATDSLDAHVVEPTAVWSSQTHEFSPEEKSEQAELASRLERALAGLPEDQRVALLMSDALGYDYSEIAALTDSAIGTVKSRISRARARLRRDLLSDPDSREHFERYGRS
jgi:RNA polymerase sigma-70 factor, ECF subfamily